ncbi:MAG: helix-turn-helix transcriptional regulator [Anaerolineales bacterium]|nr:helix-turn-helix transcriptional regulator [Anaerolineales bacterium]
MSSTLRSYPHLGEQIDHLIQMLALVKGPKYSVSSQRRSKQRIQPAIQEIAKRTGYAETTVYRWRQGRLCPPDRTIKELAKIGKEQAGLGRDWGERLFESAGYSKADARRLADETWGQNDIKPIPHNLPTPMHSRFIGKQGELERLLRLLSPQVGAHIITIDGIGGVGKNDLGAGGCLSLSEG